MEKNYLPEQIFNIDDTLPFWKLRPERNFIHKETKCMFQGFKGQDNSLAWGEGSRLQIEIICDLAQ